MMTRTPKKIKTDSLNNWKKRGIISNDWDTVYDKYVNATVCELCPKVFSSTRDRHLDHDHFILDAPNVRNIICNKCNLQKSDRKFTNNTGERHITKSFSKRRDKYYYFIRIYRDGKYVYNTTCVSLEKAIIKRDIFIKNNPSIFK